MKNQKGFGNEIQNHKEKLDTDSHIFEHIFSHCVFDYVITGVGFIFDFKADAGANIYEFTISEIPQDKEAIENFIIQIARI